MRKPPELLVEHARSELKGLPEDPQEALRKYAEHMGTDGRFITNVELSILSAAILRPVYVLEAYKVPKRRNATTTITLASCRQIGTGPILPADHWMPVDEMSDHPIILLYASEHFYLLEPTPEPNGEGGDGGGRSAPPRL
jgi:hypothetical protein